MVVAHVRACAVLAEAGELPTGKALAQLHGTGAALARSYARLAALELALVAVCRVAGADVNAWMVSQGWAVAYRKYSTDYVSHETAAKAARRGVWRGEFVVPSRWRRGERLEAAVVGGVGDSRIKGNISRKGTRIYHVPGGAWYAKTRIDTAKGERWFCTEAKARAAGWRRAKR